MAYPLNIVVNDRNWYDSRIIDGDPVVFQNINYVTGDERSVNVVRQRFTQDWARRLIPNSIRQGVGLTDPAGGSDQIVVTQGYAAVGGRFLEIPAGTFDASVEGLATGLHYLIIRVAAFTESDTRLPSAGTAALVAEILPYTKSHNDLVIAKFNYTGVVINSFEDYTAEQEWQANVISPVPARPGLTTGDDKITLRAYGGTALVEPINILGVESDKTRFYLNAVFDDQVASTEVKLINKSGVLLTRDTADTAYLGQDMLDLDIGGTAIIDSSRNLVNVGTINARTMGGNSATDLIDTDSTQTMSSKTLTAPIVTTGTFASPVLTTPEILDTTGDQKYIFGVSELTVSDKTITLPLLLASDTFVFEDHIQTLVGKTLTTPIITSLISTNTHTIPTGSGDDDFVLEDAIQSLSNKTLETLTVRENTGGAGVETFTIDFPLISANKTLTIRPVIDDHFVFELEPATLVGKTLTSPTINTATIVSPTITSGTISSPSITTPSITTPSIGLTQWINANHNHSAPNSGGVIANDSHTHDTRYFTESEITSLYTTTTDINKQELIGSSNAEWVTLQWNGGLSEGFNYTITEDNLANQVIESSSGTVNPDIRYKLVGIPYFKDGKTLKIAQVRFNIDDASSTDKVTAFYNSVFKSDATQSVTLISGSDITTDGYKTFNPTDFTLPSTTVSYYLDFRTSVQTNLRIGHAQAQIYYE